MRQPHYPASPKHVKELVAFGKECSSTLFPNPGREGCPGHGMLRAMAYRERLLSLEDLPISHVVHCSPCFQEYLRLRRISPFRRRLQIAAVSIVAIAVCVTAMQYIRTYIRGSRTPNASEARPPRPQPGGANPAVSAPRLPIKIDLAAFSPPRGIGKGDSGKAIHLPQALLRVTLQMPLGMEPGEYAVQLKDSAGTLYADTRAPGRISDGITSLEVDLDLRAMSQASFILMIRPPGLDWRTFPVVVE
jgi:hypothetical protein